jgi:hypothetical protein
MWRACGRRAQGAPSVVTVLDKELKRQVSVDGVDYTVTFTPDGFKLTAKGRRRPEVELRWRDLVSGDAAMAVALNASLAQRSRPAIQAAAEGAADPPGKTARRQASGPRRKT